MDTFDYSDAFRARIVRLHRGKEGWPHYSAYLNAHLGGLDSRLAEHRTILVRELEHHCGPLGGLRVLDFGCGTGASTAALAGVAAEVVGFDVDAESAEIARARLEEHGLTGTARVLSAEAFDPLETQLGLFDLVLLNGVVEHIPLSIPGLRQRVLASAWRAVRAGGHLVVNDTPNRLWPFDGHSTQLWFLPWTRPGSEWAYRRAVRLGRHADAPTCAPGPLGLEQVGAWGATYRELLGYLGEASAECVNLLPGHSECLSYADRGSPRRRAIERTLHATLVPALRMPLTAFAPSLNNLVFKKRAAR